MASIQGIYIALFGRPADPIGLQYWNGVTNNGADLSRIVDLASTAEYQDRFAGMNNTQIVNSIYQSLFGRDADLAGLTFFVNGLQNGTYNINNIAISILDAAQGSDAAILANKEAAANAFTASIDTTAEVLAYSGNDAAQDGRNFLANITAEASTVPSQQEVDAAIKAIVDDAPDGTVGETFTLTAAVGENVVGTSQNDVFSGVYDDGSTTTSTINVGDTINGGAGTDTLNIIAADNTGAGTTALPAGFSTKAVEKVFVTNAANGISTLNASIFDGVEQVWAVNNAEALTISNLSATQTVGVKGDATAKVTGDFGAGTAANLALDGAKGAVDLLSTDTSDKGTLNISGSSLVSAGATQTVTIAGTATANSQTVNVAAADKLKVDISAANVATTVNVSGKGNADLGTVAGTVKTIDASANTGGVTVTGAAGLQEVTGGTGGEKVTLGAALADKGFVNTGAGNDSVDIAANAINKGATINLGEGNDSIVGTGTVDKAAVINGGDGTDTLGLALVGAANVGAFSNFEVFDVKGLNGTLDLDILASKNTVTEIVGSGALVGASTLTNLGAGVGFRATSEMGANDLTLTQKTAGSLTVTLDADTTATTENDDSFDLVATNATSLKAVFDTSSGFTQTAGTKNNQNIELTGTKATTLEVVSGGSQATNELVYNGADDLTAGKGDVLTSVTITGDQSLVFTYNASDSSEISTINASAMTGDLTVATAALKNGGVIELGSGTDVVQVADNQGATTGNIEKIEGFEKAASNLADAVKVADLIDSADALTVGSEEVASANLNIANGVVTFLGTGPTTLDQAIGFVDAATTTEDSAVVFEYVGNTYVFIEAAAGDTVVELTGVTGVTELGVTGGNLFIV